MFPKYGSTKARIAAPSVAADYSRTHLPFVAFLDGLADICYVMRIGVQAPAVQDPRDTSRDRNGDTKAGCGFFMTVRSCAAALFRPQVRRITPWPAVPSSGLTSKRGLGSS